MNNTELDSESDSADSVNSDTGHDEPYCEDNIETDNNQQCSSQSSIQKSSALFLRGIKKRSLNSHSLQLMALCKE